MSNENKSNGELFTLHSLLFTLYSLLISPNFLLIADG